MFKRPTTRKSNTFHKIKSKDEIKVITCRIFHNIFSYDNVLKYKKMISKRIERVLTFSKMIEILKIDMIYCMHKITENTLPFVLFSRTIF